MDDNPGSNENGTSSKEDRGQYQNVTNQCVSMNKVNLFEIPNNNENLFSTKSVENEGEYIFSNDRTSEYYYNYNDAKELEYQFNQIQKNIHN